LPAVREFVLIFTGVTLQLEIHNTDNKL
jgi:hypothetical protein